MLHAINSPQYIKRRSLYPEIEPYHTSRLQVSALHSLYFEQCGNPQGKPAIVLHGGPGGGLSPFYRQFFDPSAYRVILFDQRGAGQSTPHACLEENTTQHLINDIEKLRVHLKIEKWLVFGGSWGSTLSLAYAQQHPQRVSELVLRGIFLVRASELKWFYQEGASWIFPDAFDHFVAPIPPAERHDLINAYYRRLTGSDEAERLKCAKAWSIWEMTTSRLFIDPEYIARAADSDQFSLAFARIESHYFVNAGFFSKDGDLLENAHLLNDIPGVIVQGRYDMVCPALSAWELSQRWKKGQLIWVQDAGHSAKEEGIIHELVSATDKFRTQ